MFSSLPGTGCPFKPDMDDNPRTNPRNIALIILYFNLIAVQK
jgi:hypothetical protein